MDWIMRLNNIVGFETGCTIMKIKMGNADIECAWSYNQIRTANTSHIEVTAAIFRHILNLFKFSGKIQLELCLDPRGVNNFPVLDGVTATALRGGPIDTSTVETFCSKYPTQKSAALLSKLSGELSPYSPILIVENVYFCDTEGQSSTILENFTGRILMIDDAQLPETSIIQFIRNWMTGSSHQNLEVLRIVFNLRFFINPGIVHEEFKNETEVRDPSKRVMHYEFNTHIIGRYRPYMFDCYDFLDIKRQSDGRTASFLVMEYKFFFCVWNS
ncbi:unnamed protein product [Caenorhabditis brenneri]